MVLRSTRFTRYGLKRLHRRQRQLELQDIYVNLIEFQIIQKIISQIK